MSLTTTAAPSTTAADTAALASRPASLRRSTVVSGLVAAAVTTAAAAAADTAGVPLAIDGEAIPVLGFAQMTFLGAVIGGVLLAVLNRRSGQARRRFLQATVVLTALSCVPSVAWPDDSASVVVLVALHLLAAALVIPALVRHART